MCQLGALELLKEERRQITVDLEVRKSGCHFSLLIAAMLQKLIINHLPDMSQRLTMCFCKQVNYIFVMVL